VLVLALDTCDSTGSVALLRDSGVLQTAVHDTAEDYSVWLLPAVSRILQAAAVPFHEVTLCAVAAGPGSFTGVRVGLTTAKAWAEVCGMGIAVVSRLEAFASQAVGAEPWVAAFADARRSQFFAALYARREGSPLQRVGDEMVIAPEKFVAWAVEQATAGAGARTDSASIRWISPHAQTMAETQAWPARRILGETLESASPVLAPTVGRLGHQLALQGRLTDALTLDANYVRQSDAEVQWRDRQGQ
jgi:tRNA threonylcarbamoyladenosine biosynthesis protein TsaB